MHIVSMQCERGGQREEGEGGERGGVGDRQTDREEEERGGNILCLYSRISAVIVVACVTDSRTHISVPSATDTTWCRQTLFLS